jgi:hypothetical protein
VSYGQGTSSPTMDNISGYVTEGDTTDTGMPTGLPNSTSLEKPKLPSQPPSFRAAFIMGDDIDVARRPACCSTEILHIMQYRRQNEVKGNELETNRKCTGTQVKGEKNPTIRKSGKMTTITTEIWEEKKLKNKIKKSIIETV